MKPGYTITDQPLEEYWRPRVQGYVDLIALGDPELAQAARAEVYEWLDKWRDQRDYAVAACDVLEEMTRTLLGEEG